MQANDSDLTSKRPLKELNLLGVPLTCLDSYEDAVAHVLSEVQRNEKLYCVAINPMKICAALQNPSLAQVVSGASLHICDGVGTAWAAKLLHGRGVCRITGVQLFFDLVAEAEREKLRIFLLGASPESNELAYRNLLARHPALIVAGRHHGYFDGDEKIVNLINEAAADLLFVAMGSPRQEFWMARNQSRLDVPFMMGVGGTFDVAAGNVKWAPPFFRRTGTEFLYRFCCQPRRFKHVMPLSRFTIAVLSEYARLRLAGR